MNYSDWIGKQVVAKTKSGEFYGMGEIISYTDAPTFTIERSDKTRFSWRCELCELGTIIMTIPEILEKMKALQDEINAILEEAHEHDCDA